MDQANPTIREMVTEGVDDAIAQRIVDDLNVLQAQGATIDELAAAATRFVRHYNLYRAALIAQVTRSILH